VKYIILQIVKIYTTFKDIKILSLCLCSTRRIDMKRFGNTLNGCHSRIMSGNVKEEILFLNGFRILIQIRIESLMGQWALVR
jgi:hypothetical protein